MFYTTNKHVNNTTNILKIAINRC